MEARGFTVRVARTTAEDVEALFDVRTSVRENHLSRAQLAALGITPESVPERLRTTSRAWIAEAEGRAVGFAMADAAERTVFALFVRPGHDGRGIGRALMAEAEAWLFASGAAEIWLTTGGDPALRAHGFYRRLGWTPAGTEPDGQLRYVRAAPAP